MSYILDALKKAEQERRRGKTPDIMTTPESSSSRPQKRLWPYAVLIMLVAAAGSVGWFFGHEKTDTATPISPQVTQNYVVPVQPQTQVTAQPATSTDTTLGPLNDKRNLSKSQAMRLPAHNKGTSTKIKPGPVATSKSSQDGASEEIRPQPEKKMVPDNKIYAINELPEAVRQGLPSITISTHIYASDKSERLAAINGHIGREGQEVMTGITLESITPDGVILRYQGYKFRIGLK